MAVIWYDMTENDWRVGTMETTLLLLLRDLASISIERPKSLLEPNPEGFGRMPE